MDLYTLKDKITGEYLMPFYASNDNAAKRAARDIIEDTANIKQHISDYELFQIAEVDIKFIDYLENINEQKKRFGF